jgi:hypothetical protein
MTRSRPITQLPRDAGFRRPKLEERMDQVLRWLREGPQDRKILAMRLACDDRRMRMAIEELRLRGELVLTLKGMYRLATTRAEFDEWVRIEQQSRLATFHMQLSEMTRRADRLWPLEPRALAPRPMPKRTSPGQLAMAI